MKYHTTTELTARIQHGGAASDVDCLENMRELLADLRYSIQVQRDLINASRALLDRS